MPLKSGTTFARPLPVGEAETGGRHIDHDHGYMVPDMVPGACYSGAVVKKASVGTSPLSQAAIIRACKINMRR